MPPRRFPDCYFFPAPGLLVLALQCLAGPPLPSLPYELPSARVPLPYPAPTPWSLCRWGLPAQVSAAEPSPFMPWAAPGTLALQITSGKLSQALPRLHGESFEAPEAAATCTRGPGGKGAQVRRVPRRKDTSASRGFADGCFKAPQHRRVGDASSTPSCDCSVRLSPLPDMPSAHSAHH